MGSIVFKPELVLSVLVSDWEASRKWYAEKLGFEETFAVPEAGWAELQSPLVGATIGMNALHGEPHPGPGAVSITFGVEDVDAARAELERRGVEFQGATEEIPGMVKLARFEDPDGTVMMLAQNLM